MGRSSGSGSGSVKDQEREKNKWWRTLPKYVTLNYIAIIFMLV